MPSLRPADGTEVRLLGYNEACPWKLSAEGLRVEVPATAREKPPCEHAWVFQVRGKTAGKNDEMPNDERMTKLEWRTGSTVGDEVRDKVLVEDTEAAVFSASRSC